MHSKSFSRESSQNGQRSQLNNIASIPSVRPPCLLSLPARDSELELAGGGVEEDALVSLFHPQLFIVLFNGVEEKSPLR